jgi:hypothetical protein
MRNIALLLLCLGASSTAAAQQPGQQQIFAHGGWTGLRQTDERGQTLMCMVTTAAAQQDGLVISLYPQGGLTITLVKEGLKFGRDSVEAQVTVDGVTIATHVDILDGKGLRAGFTAPDDRAVYDRLRTGRVLDIRTKKGGQNYDISDLAQALPAVLECVTASASAGALPPSDVSTSPRGPGTPFDVPGATRVDKSQVMAVLANSMADHNEPRHKFLLADELGKVLPGYDVAWRTETGVLVGTAVRGKVGAAGTDATIGNLIGQDAARCTGKLKIVVGHRPAEDASENGWSKDIHAYCDGGGNTKETHYMVWSFANDGMMVTRFEPISMKDPNMLWDEMYDANEPPQGDKD